MLDGVSAGFFRISLLHGIYDQFMLIYNFFGSLTGLKIYIAEARYLLLQILTQIDQIRITAAMGDHIVKVSVRLRQFFLIAGGDSLFHRRPPLCELPSILRQTY